MCFRNVGGRHSVQEESAKEVVKERGASSPGGERCAACRIRHKLPLMLSLLLHFYSSRVERMQNVRGMRADQAARHGGRREEGPLQVLVVLNHICKDFKHLLKHFLILGPWYPLNLSGFC